MTKYPGCVSLGTLSIIHRESFKKLVHGMTSGTPLYIYLLSHLPECVVTTNYVTVHLMHPN